MYYFLQRFKKLVFSISWVMLGFLSIVFGQTYAQGTQSSWRVATEEEEAMVLKGFIFYPHLRVRTPEEKNAEAATRKAQAERYIKKAVELTRKETEAQERLRVEQTALMQAHDLARHQAAEKGEAEAVARKLERQRAQQQVEEPGPVTSDPKFLAKFRGEIINSSSLLTQVSNSPPLLGIHHRGSNPFAKPGTLVEPAPVMVIFTPQPTFLAANDTDKPPPSTPIYPNLPRPPAVADQTTAGTAVKVFSSPQPPKEAPPPTFTIKTPDKSRQLSLGPNQSALSIEDETFRMDAAVGLGYRSGTDSQPTAQIKASKLLGKYIAVGGYLNTSPGLNDFVLSSASSLDGGRIHPRLSVGHMWGEQRFNFLSGAANAKLGQSSVVVAVNYQVTRNNIGIETLGGALWAARANQKSGLQSVEFETSSGGVTFNYSDPRLLSEGTLRGAALNLALSPTANLHLSSSFGTESVVYPFSDGTKNSYEQLTGSLSGELNLSGEDTIYGEYRKGVAERRSTLILKLGNWSVKAFNSEGLYGLANNRGVSVSYSLLGLFDNRSRAKQRGHTTAANTPSVNLLNIASQRPSEMPRTFLAKVDATAVRLLSTRAGAITFTNSSGSQGVYFDTGAPNRTSVSFTVAASASDGSATTYVWGSDPDNLQGVLSLNTATGVISGSHPAVATDKTYTFTIVATANGTSIASGNLTLTIRAPVRVRFTTSGASAELGSATTTATSITLPSELQSIELLMVGGGGAGGGGDGGGGGGAGAVAYGTAVSISGGVSTSVTVGAGGTGTLVRGMSGSATSFGTLNALGGGGGGMSNPDYEGIAGGSGGGASQNYAGGAAGAECGITISALFYSCTSGGGSIGTAVYGGSGGGGALGAGVTATTGNGRNGGTGYTIPASLGGGTIAGGGGGGSDGLAGSVSGSGGSSVGGNGGNNTTSPTSAAPETGSGGGGGGTIEHTGGDGGGGLIILRY